MDATETDLAGAAAKLIYKGLNTKANPHQDREYRDLVRTWQAEPRFRSIVAAIADGLALAVLDVSDKGIVIAPRDAESRFAMGVTEYRRSLERDGKDVERATLAMLQLGVATAFFPTAAKLDDIEDTPETLRLSDIRDVILNLCHKLAHAHQEDAQALPPLLRGVWERLLAMPVHQPDAQRASLSSLDGALQIVIHQLSEQGLVRVMQGTQGDIYFASNRYRLMVARHASEELFALCQHLIRDEEEAPR